MTDEFECFNHQVCGAIECLEDAAANPLESLSEKYQQGILSEAAKAELTALSPSDRGEFAWGMAALLERIPQRFLKRLTHQIRCLQIFGGMKRALGWPLWIELS